MREQLIADRGPSRLSRYKKPQVQATPSWVDPPDWSAYEEVGFTSDAVNLIRSMLGSDSHGVLYETQWAVRTCVDFLALNIAQLNLKTYRRTDGTPEQLRDHALHRLIQRPNDRWTRYDLIRATVSDLAIYDNAFWLKRQVGNRRALYLLPPAYVVVDGGNILTGPARYWLSSGGTREELNPADVVHFHGYNPIDTRVGSSPMSALRYVLMEEAEASRWRSKFFAKAAQIPGVIERPSSAPPWGQIERDRFREDWRRFRRGGALQGEEPILEDDMKYKAEGFSPEQSQFIEGRDWVLKTVATQFHIPLGYLNKDGTRTYAAAKDDARHLYVDVLGPWNAMLESAVNAQLVPDFGDDDLYVEFNIEEKLQGDFEQQATAARQSVQVPWHSVNEMREKRGLPRIDDPIYDKPARPTNYTYGDAPEAPEQQTLGLDDELATMLEDR